MGVNLRKSLFETLYKHRYLYRFASTIPFAGQWRVWQRLVLPRIVGADVLELGCGLGDLLADMIAAGYNCRAVEQSPEMLEAARATLRRRKLGEQTWVLQGASQRLPFAAGSFDTVVSTFPTEYIYDNDTIAAVARTLRPGGRLIVVEGANLLPIGFLQPLLLLTHLVVYGSAAVFGPRKTRNLDDEIARHRQDQRPQESSAHSHREMAAGVTTEVVTGEEAWFGKHIPLELHGLRRRSERVRSPRWEVYIVIGEKPE